MRSTNGPKVNGVDHKLIRRRTSGSLAGSKFPWRCDALADRSRMSLVSSFKSIGKRVCVEQPLAGFSTIQSSALQLFHRDVSATPALE